MRTSSIRDDYEIKEDILGYGSYSTCKRCIQCGTGQEMAVKVSRKYVDGRDWRKEWDEGRVCVGGVMWW